MNKRHFNEKYTDEELLEILKNYSKIKFPTYRDFNSKNGLPSGRTYVDRFGSFQNAILKAGIEIPKERLRYFNREQLPDNVLLDLLKQETEKMIKKKIDC